MKTHKGTTLVELINGFILLLFMTVMFSACTADTGSGPLGQWLGRTGFGTYEVKLPPGKKLVGAPNWKGTHLWVLTRDARLGEKPETYSFKEDSTWGVLEGEAIIKETEAPAAQGR